MNALQLRLRAMMVIATMVLFVAMLVINEWLLARFELVRGINGIYLPAGIRLLSTLLFAESGAIVAMTIMARSRSCSAFMRAWLELNQFL